MQAFRAVLLLLSVMIVPLLAARCGGDPDHAAAAGDDSSARSAAEKSAAPAARRDACELITAADIAEIEGTQIRAHPGEARGAHESVCEYGPADAGPEATYISLKVYWRDGRDEWSTWGAARGLGARLLQDPEVPVDSIIAGDPLAGIGDGAHYGDLLPSLVLKGDTLLELQIAMLNNARENFPILARKALARLDPRAGTL